MDNIETTRNYDAIRDMYNILNVLKAYDAKIYVTNHGLAGSPEFSAEILIEDFYRIEIVFYGNDNYMFYLRHPCYLQSDVDSSLGVAKELKRFIKSCEAAWYDELYKKLNNPTSVSKVDMEKMLKFYNTKLHYKTLGMTLKSIDINNNDELNEYAKSIYYISERIVKISDCLRYCNLRR